MLARFLIIVLIEVFCIAPAYCADLVVFKDSGNGFSIKYPKTWEKMQPNQEQTKFKVISKNGKGDEECSVNVQNNPNLASRTPRDFIDSIKKASKEQLQANIRKGAPSAVIIDMGETTLSNQPAFFQKFSMTNEALGKNLYISYGAMTINGGKAYTVGCISEQKSFDKNFELFKTIISSFTLPK